MEVARMCSECSVSFAAAVLTQVTLRPGPATGQHIADVPNLKLTQAEVAVKKTLAGFDSWRLTTVSERQTKLQAWATAIADHSAELAQLMALEAGKPFKEGLGEVAYGWLLPKVFSTKLMNCRRVFRIVVC